MTEATKIKGVSCYGKVEPNSNYLIVGDAEDGYELEIIWYGNGETSWTQVINKILAAYDSSEIYEVSAV